MINATLCFQTEDKSGFGQRDAGGEREQRRRPSGQTEEEVPQLVHPPDQQHRAGSLGPAERHAGGTGELSDGHNAQKLLALHLSGTKNRYMNIQVGFKNKIQNQHLETEAADAHASP